MIRIKYLRFFLLPAVAFLLTGCNAVLLNPSGDIAVQQRDLLYLATGLMLIVIIPVMIAIVVFAWRYRSTNTSARYDPDWYHSTKLELVIWSVPLMIIIALGTVTWVSTHKLDPYRPLDRIAAGQPVAKDVRPLTVEVVALDWKWLFIYPEYGIASLNELAAPVDRPIEFKITSSSVMNSFFIPALAGQIYAMAGMETKLHAVINKPGEYDGISANYSGAGFSGMRFKFHGLAQADFDKWVQSARAAGGNLDRGGYLQLERPSENEPVRHYASVATDLYDAILNRCVAPGTVCMRDIMMMDAKAGAAGRRGAEHEGMPGMGHTAAPAMQHEGMAGMKHEDMAGMAGMSGMQHEGMAMHADHDGQAPALHDTHVAPDAK